jgi:aspartyl-tRNA(Asn)/glutamyl-tRNA(Gln) amidotransferase subunit C
MAQVSVESGQPAGEPAWRNDIPRPSLPHTDAMKNAPETDGDFFKVPKVIEK